MAIHTLGAACVGKVPTHGDFVRYRATTPALRAFDDWTQSGLFQARKQRAALDAVYDAAPAYRFVYQAPQQHAPLIGVMKASRDRAGRMYPFTVAAEVEPQASRGRRFPHVFDQARSFYDDAQALVQTATAGNLAHPAITDRVQAMAPTLQTGDAPSPDYQRYLQRETMRTWTEALFGHFGNGHKYRLFSNLLDVTRPLQGREHIRVTYGLKFPLGSAGDNHTFQATFWAELCFRLLDGPPAAPSAFWTVPSGENGTEPTLFFFLSPPSPAAFFHLMAPEREGDPICDLVTMGARSATEAALALPETYGKPLETETLTLREFLRAL